MIAHGSAATAQQQSLPAVTITGNAAPPPADVAGFGDVPVSELPLSATVVTRKELDAAGARRLSDLTNFDASVTDAYNSPGYWDFLSVRGFTLDNRFNYRREGLPISAETAIPLDNKERIEILKGTSGIQAGTSAPGGLVNYVVKRPTQTDLRSARLEFLSRGSVLGAVDLGGRAGPDGVFGYRINIAAERLRPQTDSLDGHRRLVGFAGDWRIGRDSILQLEGEWSHKSQPSQAGFSLRGGTLPSPPNPRININNQPWSQPSVFDAATGSLRFEQVLGASWRWSAQVGTQRLKTDDRLAFPFGCGAEGNFDRFCSDGTFDFYDFRSENERRRQDAASLNLRGKVNAGTVVHELAFGVLASRVRNRFEQSAFNPTLPPTGTDDGGTVVAPNPARLTPNTDRDERSLELSVQDVIRWTPAFTTWLGVRHTRLDRDSIRTDGTAATGYRQAVTTPWLALSYKLTPSQTLYASYGEGVESQVVPTVPDPFLGAPASQFTNAGEALSAVTSKQYELGLKSAGAPFAWQLAAFRIERPMTNIDACTRLFVSPCTAQYDGRAVHNGLETSASWTSGALRLQGGLTFIDAKRQGSTFEPATNGKRPANVPRVVARAQAIWRVPGIEGLDLRGLVAHEGKRSVLADGSITLPSWTRVDVAMQYASTTFGMPATWTLAVDNLFDRRYWKESPYQFGHVYLYPGAPRTFRLAVQTAL